MISCNSSIPPEIVNDYVLKYYNILQSKYLYLKFKRLFDIILSLLLLIILFPICLIVSILIIIDSPGPVFFRQARVTTYGKIFFIHKFRTMNVNTDNNCSITSSNDSRITHIGKYLRKFKIDEFPQLLDILVGNMSFVGTRPETVKFVSMYKDEWKATLLLPAGVTSSASIKYKNENDLLINSKDIEKDYFNKILPKKMEYNLKDIENISFINELLIIFNTFLSIFIKS